MVHAGAAGLFGVIAALVALACLSAQLGPGRAALISAARRGAAGSADQHADTGRGQTVATRLLRSQTLSGAFVGALVKGIKRDVKHVERDGAALQSAGAGRGQLPSMRQVLKLRKKRSAERARKADHYRQELSAHLVDCKGKSEAECDMVLDAETLGNIFQPLSAQQEAVELLQLNRFQASAQEFQRRMGGGSDRAGSASLTTLERQEADLEKQNRLERQIHALLQDNAKLARRNAQLSKAGADATDKGVKGAQQLHAHVQGGEHNIVKDHIVTDHIVTDHTEGGKHHHIVTDHIVTDHIVEHTEGGEHHGEHHTEGGEHHTEGGDSSVLGNPPGIPELVPATVSAEPPEKPDFNGATAMIARLPPGVGYGPSLLDANGVEERGSFTLRKANPYGGIWIRAYGKMNHPIKCTLKGYRKLGGMFMGQTVYTGYKKSWSGKTTISTGIIPPGSSNTFDLVTCRDMQTGEVQHFRTNPTPSPGFFSDPGDPEFQDEYTSHAINPDHP